MRPVGNEPQEIVAHWREAGEWWLNQPPREVVRYLDREGIRREEVRELPALGAEAPAAPAKEDHTEDWCLRPRRAGGPPPTRTHTERELRRRKIRDEKAAAACNALPASYYHEQAEERKLQTAWAITSGSIGTPLKGGTGYAALHCWSGYAFCRSTMLAEEIPALAAAGGCSAAAITDPHSLMGALEFARSCRKNGIQPLIGASIELPEGGEIVLIARSKEGYRQLSNLITRCHLEQPRGFPLATHALLDQWRTDLLCLTGGDRGPLNRLLLRKRTGAALALLEQLIQRYGRGNVFVEIERSYLPWQVVLNQDLEQLAAAKGLVCVAGGVSHHARPEHFPAQDILVCADTLCTVEEVIGRKPLRTPEQPASEAWPERSLNAERYLRTHEEMLALYADRPDLLANTRRVAERCDPDVLPPRTRPPQVFPDDAHALWEIVHAEARWRYPKLDRRILRRLDYELDRITRLDFASHFLIAWDFCRYAREHQIQLSGRGSVVDSAVAYCLGFSRIDAIRHKLHFDRFLPDDGTKRPDIDIDFEAKHRDDIRNYMTRKYGLERTATVAAVGALCTRGIIREVGKALGLPNEAIGFLAKRIHGGVPPDQIEAALDRKPELRASGIDRDRFRWVFRLSQRLMDIPRNVRCHSSGVVVSDRPIADTVPVMCSASPFPDGPFSERYEGLPIIQWDKRSAKYCFDKFDVLCLRGQDVLSGTQERVRVSTPDFDVEQAPIDDEETYRAMRSGELIGIPQSASPAMRQAHMRLRTRDLTDASLVQAGIRPGVGGAVKINELIARRRGKPYSFDHPELERILGHTYGIIVFQEQVDQLLQTFGGYTGGEAEDIRDAIHKRRREDYGVMIRDQLIARVTERGFGAAVAEQVFELVAGFKGYGFAQGHALAFAEISIRSIYCQQNFPAEYFASLLSAQPAGYYGPCTIVNEARSRGVQILGPDVNASEEAFSVEDVRNEDPAILLPSGGIRIGLQQVHGLSAGTLERLLEARGLWMAVEEELENGARSPAYLPAESVAAREHGPGLPPGRPDRPGRVQPQDRPPRPRRSMPERPFRSLFDLAARVSPSRDELESLILCGALDSLHPNRKQMLWALPRVLEFMAAHRTLHDPRHPSLPLLLPEPPMPEVPDFDEEERAVQVRRTLGLDVQRHLMAFERERVAAKGGVTTQEARRLAPGSKAIVVGNPIRLRFPPTATGKRVVFWDLEDETGLLNVTAFDDVYQVDGHAIVCSPYLTVIGEAQDRDGHTAFLAKKVFPYRPRLLRDREADLPVTRTDFLVG